MLVVILIKTNQKTECTHMHLRYED